MAILQNLLKEAFESSGDYEKAINSVLKNLQQNSIITMNNTQYALLSKPQIYKGSISVNSADFSPTELSLSLTNMDGTGNRLSLSSPYNSWAGGKVLNLQDQFRNMYDYLNNIDPIEIGRKLTDDEMDNLMDSVVRAKKNKTSVSIDYSGTGLNNAINFLNSDRGPININTNTTSTVDNSPLGKLNRLMSKSNVDKKMWINRNFVFGEDFVNNKDFRNTVLDFYSQGDRKSDLLNKLVSFKDFSADNFYYEAYGNMFEAYKELEGLDSKGLQKKIVDEVKSWNISEREIQNHFDLLKDGAEHIGWQGSRDFIDYDPSLYKEKFKFTSNTNTKRNVPMRNSEVELPLSLEEINSIIEETASNVQKELGINNLHVNSVFGEFEDPSLSYTTGSQWGGNYIEIYPNEIWKDAYLNNQLAGLDAPTKDDFIKHLRTSTAHESRHAWQFSSEEGKEYLRKHKEHMDLPIDHFEDEFDKYESDPIEVDARKYGDYYAENHESISSKYKKTKNVNLDDFKNNTQKFFENKNVSNQDIVDNFDKYFTQAIDSIDFSKINGEDLMTYRDELKKQYETRLNDEIKAKSEESRRRRQQEIEDRKKNSRPSDDAYWNGQQKKTVQHLENGVVAELYYSEDGEVLVQKLLYPDGKRDISVRRTRKDLAKFSPEELDGARHQISKKRVIREGNNIYISKNPDSMHTSATNINLETGEVETTEIERLYPWSGGKQDEKITTSKLKKNISKSDEESTKQEESKTQQQPIDPEDATSSVDIEDLDPETLANLTDEEIEEWATSADDYNRAINLREQARQQQQQRNAQGNQGHKIDTDKPWTWTDDDIRTMADGDPDVAANLINQRERARKKTRKKTNLKNDQIENKYSDKPKRKTKGKKKKASKKSFDLNAKPIKTRKMGDFKKVVSSVIVNEAIEAAEETIEEAVETTAKSIVKDQPYNVLNMKHPSQMTDSELANFTDEEFEQLKSLFNGNKRDFDNWEERRNKGKAEKIYNDFVNGESNYYHSNVENTHPYEYERPETDFEVDENGNVKIKKGTENRKIEVEDNKTSKRKMMESPNTRPSKSIDDVFDWMKKHKIGMLDIGINLFTSIGDYKNARRQGHGVLSSTARAAASFAMGEMLGFWGSVGVGLAKGAGSLAIKGTELLYKENRRMNSAANKQAFGTAEFYDTQQLATMRQSGMEMAKMAQYNLQQTLMGNEASFLHR